MCAKRTNGGNEGKKEWKLQTRCFGKLTERYEGREKREERTRENLREKEQREEGIC